MVKTLNPQKSHVVLYLHSFLILLVNECVTLLQSNTQYSIYTKKEMPSSLVEVADFRSSSTQKHVLLFGLVSLPLQILLILGHERMLWMFISVLCG